MSSRHLFWWPVCTLLAASAVAAEPASKPKPPSPAEMRRLDAKLAAVSDSFLRDTTTLIASYENAGQFDRAKLILEVLQKLDPKNEAIQTKLKLLNGRIMEATLQELDLDADAQWTPVGRVVKGRPIRIEASGEYKVTATVETGPAGLPSANPVTDMVAGIPLGGLMGVILPAAASPATEGQASQGNQQPQQPRPFPVGATYDRPADRDGILYLKVNVPPGSKCTGQLRARLSGADNTD